MYDSNHSTDENLPILTDIVSSPRLSREEANRGAKKSTAKLSKQIILSGNKADKNNKPLTKVVPIPIQPSTINFLQPIRSTSTTASTAKTNDKNKKAPLKNTKEVNDSSLSELFDENPERSQERQILHLAEERAYRRAEEVLAEKVQLMQESLMQEMMKTLPDVVARQVREQQDNIMKNAMKTVLMPNIEDGIESFSDFNVLYSKKLNSEKDNSTLERSLQKTQLIESSTSELSISQQNSPPETKWK